MDTGAADFVALEAKLCETEATCERLRAGVQSTEMEMAEVCVCVCVYVCVCVRVSFVCICRANRLTNEQTSELRTPRVTVNSHYRNAF